MRTRTIYDNEQLIIKFINRNYNGNERNKRYNLYIEGNALYSYGEHYCLAKWVVNKRNESAIDVCLYPYSNTTKRQIDLLINLLDYQKTIYRYTQEGGIKNIITMKEMLDELCNKFFKARVNKNIYYETIQDLVYKAIDYIEFYDYHLGNEETILNFYEFCKTIKDLPTENMQFIILSKIKIPV